MEFVEKDPTLENYWRAIILFGANTASYHLDRLVTQNNVQLIILSYHQHLIKNSHVVCIYHSMVNTNI